jgi:hypothetical protein
MWHGVAIVDAKYPQRSGTADKFFYLRDLAIGLGFTTLKVELSVAYATKYNHTPWGTPATLAQLLAEPSMAAVIGHASIQRVQFSVFSLAYALDNPWAGPWNDAIGDLIEQEFYDACTYLRTTYAGTGTEFLMANWEGDWQLLNAMTRSASVPLARLQAYRDWHRRRHRALKKAVADTSGDVTLRYFIEANRVRDRYSVRVVPDVLSKCPHDGVSLSTYETIEGWTAEGGSISTQAAFEADIAAKLTDVVGRVRESSSAPIVIGEYGFPQLAPYFTGFGFDVQALHQVKIDTAIALGVEGGIFWQLCDNEEYSAGNPVGFACYNRDGNNATVGALTDSGLFYQALL